MHLPLSFSRFCHRYDLDASKSDSQRLYGIYIKKLDVFNLVMTKLIVNQALKKTMAL